MIGHKLLWHYGMADTARRRVHQDHTDAEREAFDRQMARQRAR